MNWYCAALAYWGAGKYELAYKAAMKIEKVQPRHSVLLGQSLLQLSNSDSKKILAHFYVAAATGEVESLYQIARFARWGQGVRKDCGFALKLNKTLAEANSEKAAFEVAAIYSLGECVRKNELESSRWLIKSADLGFCTAAYMVASRYYHGTNGFVRDESKALEYADIAIASNDERGFGLKGLLLVEGKLKLYKKGYELLKKSSNLGDKDANRYFNFT